jgi:hypothetical protein
MEDAINLKRRSWRSRLNNLKNTDRREAFTLRRRCGSPSFMGYPQDIPTLKHEEIL